MTDNLALLDAIAAHDDFRCAIFLTYGADLAFFEDAVLYPLWQRGCRNILAFIDDERYGIPYETCAERIRRWESATYRFPSASVKPMRSTPSWSCY